MKRLTILLALLACSLALSAQTLKGVVVNGTTHKPAAGDEVVLVKLAQNMDEEARTKTNAKGEFTLRVPSADSAHMVRVRHEKVNYNEPVTPGSLELRITVYDSLPKVPEVELIDQSEILQAKGEDLNVIELFRLMNTSNPPVTQQSFEFYLPEGAKIRRAQAVSASGMPIPVTAEPLTEKNKYAFQYPVKPGNTQFELVYKLPYTGTSKLDPKLTLLAKKFYVVTPKSIHFAPSSSASYRSEPWPIEQMDVDSHVADNAGPGSQLAYEITGMGLLPEDNPQQSNQGNSRQQGNRPGGGMAPPNQEPNPISGQWAFLGVLVLFLAAGGFWIIMSRQQEAAPAAASAAGAKGKNASLLAALKEEIFQLEADRAQGKISAEDYATTKAGLDRTLQRVMKGKR